MDKNFLYVKLIVGLTILAFCLPSFPLLTLSHAETANEILNVSIKVNDQSKNLPLKIEGAQPIFVMVQEDEVNGFVEMSVYLATDIDKMFTISSDLRDFFATADGAKTITAGKDRVMFQAQDQRVQIFAYGEVPRKSLFTIMRVVGESDLLNVLARNDLHSTDTLQSESKQKDQSNSNPLDNPVLAKLSNVITNSTLPNKDHYLLLMQELEKTFKDSREDEAESRALATIDEIHDREKLFEQNKRECERSRLKIIEVEDLIKKTDAPDQAMNDANRELSHSKSYQESFLCDEALSSAQKAENAVRLSPIEWVGMEYPWLLPGGIIVAIGFVAFVLVQKYKSENSGMAIK